MNKWSEQYLSNIQAEHMQRLDAKYRAGDKEHDGDLRDMTPLQAINEAIDENIDQYVYLMRVKEHIE